ncbi:1,4-alpha-glucan branching protein domain-containing protein [Thalassiella azotivora]
MRTTPSRDAPLGTFCLVLHSHLPWLVHHGRWPVGEEWLHQAWAGCYVPLTQVLGRLSAAGHRDLLTLGVTPVLADQLDDRYAVRATAEWVADWRLRAHALAAHPDPRRRDLAVAEHRAATGVGAALASTWAGGGTPVLAGLAAAGAVELLAGPATHSFTPLLEPDVARWALRAGLDDARHRGLSADRWSGPGAPQGIWAPECGHAPGLQALYQEAGVGHLVLDEATVTAAGRPTWAGWRATGSDVVVVGRDLGVTDRIWSSRSGYPTGAAYRDFHAVDVGSGLALHAVTGTDVDPADKALYDPVAAATQVRRDVADFVGAVRARLAEVAAARGAPGLVVAAYDTELFGHWWHEGPAFLEQVLPALRAAGVRVTTLRRALHGEAGHPPLVDGDADVGAGSWGAGKDYSVWAGPAVRPLVDEAFWVQRRLQDLLARELGPGADALTRRPDLDQLVRQALLALSSDWAFMVTRDSAADYAVRRAQEHRDLFHRLAELVAAGAGRRADALAEAARQRRADGPFASLDARALVRGGWAAGTPGPRS